MFLSNFHNVHFHLKVTKLKKVLAIFLMGKIAWILWFLISQIVNRDTIGLLFLIILFKFIAEGASVFPRYISILFLLIQLLFQQD